MGKRILKEIVINEISAVDKPAQKGALATIMKRNGPKDKKAPFSKSVKMTTAHNGHQHIVDTTGYDGEYLHGGTTDWSRAEGEEMGHNPPWLRDENGGVVIGEALGHIHSIADVNKSAQETFNGEKVMASRIKKSLLATAALTALAIQKFDDTADWGVEEASDIRKSAVDHNIEGLLPDTGLLSKAADNDDDDEEAGKKKKMAEMDEKLKKMEAIANLSTVEKAHYDALDETGQNKFLKADKSDRSGMIEKASGDDPVVFTALDGTEFRKSDDIRVVELAKRLDQKEQELAKAAVQTRDRNIEKRSDEFSNLPGKSEIKKGMIGAIEDIEDADIRKGVYEILKAADNALDSDFTPSGAISKSDAKGAEQKLNDLAKSYAKDHKVDFAKAYREITKTDDGRALYNQMRLGEFEG